MDAAVWVAVISFVVGPFVGYFIRRRELKDEKEINTQLRDEIANLKKVQSLENISDLKFGLKITSPTPGQKFSGVTGNLIVDVSGTYKVKPPLGTTLRLFVKTNYGYWRQERVTEIEDGHWHGRIGLWKEANEQPYAGYIIATVLDESGENVVLYADKVQNYSEKNISFDKLPSYLDKSEEILVYRE